MSVKKPNKNWIRVTCPLCRGSGRRGNRVCSLCKGDGTISVPREEDDELPDT